MRRGQRGFATGHRPAMGQALVECVRAHPNDGVTNSSDEASGDHVGRGRPARPPAPADVPAVSIDDRAWWEVDPARTPQAQYGPLPDRRLSRDPAELPWDGVGPWPRDNWGAPMRPSDLLGIDPQVLTALVQAGQAAGTIAAEVTPEVIAARRAKMEANAAKAQAQLEGRRGKRDEAAARRAHAEAAHAEAASPTRGRTAVWVVGGVLGVTALVVVGVVLFRRPAVEPVPAAA